MSQFSYFEDLPVKTIDGKETFKSRCCRHCKKYLNEWVLEDDEDTSCVFICKRCHNFTFDGDDFIEQGHCKCGESNHVPSKKQPGPYVRSYIKGGRYVGPWFGCKDIDHINGPLDEDITMDFEI